MYYNVGFGGRRGGGDGARGRTMRSYAGGIAGGALGALGGLAGESRSLGGFLSNLQVGAMQGGAAGRGLANLATSRRRQARADMEQQAKDDYDKQRAQADFEYRQQNPSLATRMNPMNINRRRFEAEQGRLQQARETTQRTLDANEQLGRDLASLGKEKLRQDKREAKGRDMKLEEYRRQKPALALASSMDEQQINAFNQMLDTAPRLGEMAQQPQVPQQIQQAAGFNQTDKTVDEQINAPENRDPYSNSVEASQAEMSEESQQGGGGEQQPPSRAGSGDVEMQARIKADLMARLGGPQ
jgi:hypothetical protein